MAKAKKKRAKIDFHTSDKVREVTAVDGTRARGGKPVGSNNKDMPDYKKMKATLIEIFNDSRAPAIISMCLNMRVPPALAPRNRDKLTTDEDAYFRKLMWKNFQWAVEIIIKVAPKELGVFGKVDHEFTLAGLVKRATVSPKSRDVVDMIQDRRVSETTSFVASEMNEGDGEVDS